MREVRCKRNQIKVCKTATLVLVITIEGTKGQLKMISRVQLMEKLKYTEWDDIEFKTAGSNSPKNVLNAVSAFANTNGGHIVFGVREKDGKFVISGVKDVDKVQNEFLTRTRDSQQISYQLSIEPQRLKLDDGHVLCFYIPEAPAEAKPVHLYKNLGQAYIRRGASNYRCDREELMDFIRNADTKSAYDAQPIEYDVETFFDKASLNWYRAEFEARKSAEERNIDDKTFLTENNFLTEKNGRQVPTRAAVLLFGDERHFRQCLSKIVVDMQWYNHPKSEYSPVRRWGDRELLEVNLVTAWQKINQFFDKHSLRPFVINPTTLHRVDDPPENNCYREAAVNLLVHQDYGICGRHSVIKIFKDVVEFSNPGNAFAPARKLLEGGEKRVRNPELVTAFRRANLSEQAGTGIGKIFTNWRILNYVPPAIEDDKQERTFRLKFPKQKLVDEKQSEIINRLGVDLSLKEASVFAFLLKFGEVTTFDLMALTGLYSSSALTIGNSLVNHGLAKTASDSTVKFELNYDKLRDESSRLNTNQADKTSNQVSYTISDIQRKVINLLNEPKSLTQIMKKLGYKDRKNFRESHFNLLLKTGAIEMTDPNNPKSSNQKYVNTEYGRKLKNS